ncbi:hypothetical protein OJF2_03330 [Aquisphaera giovannonii]|uniref:Uncharacterized protein n=1 Tax=Aquisphaera giovannonii TaxID=406548 RepID=A0A5B9VTM1_9BACT|nr:hypothetical protein [Aquisphaera giovannonii]QEH31866.1 hypothetical protein OJF2_03330 [Aquisphaera giovannonii]
MRSRIHSRHDTLRSLLILGAFACILALAMVGPGHGPVSGRAEGAAPPPKRSLAPGPQVVLRAAARKPKKKPKRSATQTSSVVTTPWVVLGYNDLGMHCMNQDFSEICILPPYNNLHAQVIRRGPEPQIMALGAVVRYSIPGNTISSNKTNFWTYARALFGVNLAPDVGLTGNRLSGTMTPTLSRDWQATGIPLTPIMDNGALNPYALATIDAYDTGGRKMATTRAVVPVSWEISCDLCHGVTNTASNILQAHDRLHHTNLHNNKPVLCSGCHADPALGKPGVAGVPTLSASMHTAHASRFTPAVMNAVGGINCYACHPGIQTHCQRDVHLANGIHCGDCHGSMAAVGNPLRTPWVDEPKCSNCHHVPGHQYEEPGKLYKQSRGHNGVMCAACHGSPHAITPTVTPNDNVQALAIQGHAGTIDRCVVCHKSTPEDGFNHSFDGGD